MSATPTPVIESPLHLLIADFLKVLANERGSSTHTLRAYQRELYLFARWLSTQPKFNADADANATELVQRIEHTDIRAYLAVLYARGLSRASAARALAA